MDSSGFEPEASTILEPLLAQDRRIFLLPVNAFFLCKKERVLPRWRSTGLIYEPVSSKDRQCGYITRNRGTNEHPTKSLPHLPWGEALSFFPRKEWLAGVGI